LVNMKEEWLDREIWLWMYDITDMCVSVRLAL
jgi:hypothetical protein